MSKRVNPIYFLSLLAILLFFGHSWEDGLKMDAMTGAVLAKNILRTGDWSVLHYTPSVFQDFYIHVPLLAWLLAIAFKCFGVSDTTARLFPSLLGLGTFAGVVFWGNRFFHRKGGFISGLVLLTSFSFIKYAGDAIGDGVFAFFILWALIFFLLATQKQNGFFWSLASGLFLGISVLAKSVFVIMPLLALVLTLIRYRKDLFTWKIPFGIGIGFVLPILVWFIFGEGYSYLSVHLSNISDRAGVGESSVFKVVGHLFLNYWPWFLVFSGSTVLFFKEWKESSPAVFLAFVTAWLFIVALSLSNRFFEHYLTPAYPLISVAIAGIWSRRVTNLFQERLEFLVIIGSLFFALVLAIFPVRLRQQRAEPLKSFLLEAEKRCLGQREFLFTEGSQERWLATATILWVTPREATFVTAIPTIVNENQLLIAGAKESISSDVWRKVALENTHFQLFEPKSRPLCKVF